MAKLTKIVKVLSPDDYSQEALSENNSYLTLVTNFNKNELEKYKQIIKSFNSHVVFGISDEAWGFDEDRCYGFKVDGYGLFISDRKQLSSFWKHEQCMGYVNRYRPGYVAGYVGYIMNPVKQPKTAVQRKRYTKRSCR